MARTSLLIFLPFIIFFACWFIAGCSRIRDTFYQVAVSGGGISFQDLSPYEALNSPGDYYVKRTEHDFDISLHRDTSTEWTVKSSSNGLKDITVRDMNDEGKMITVVSGTVTGSENEHMFLSYGEQMDLEADFTIINGEISNLQIINAKEGK